MLLTDQLIQKGKEANRKSNLSMAEKAEEMLVILKERQKEFTNQKQLLNCIKFAVNQLNKEGWPLYKVEMFVQ